MVATIGPVQFSASNVTAPGFNGFTVVPSDTVNHTAVARGLFTGTAGNISLVTPAGTTLIFVGVTAGSIIPVMSIRVNATNTTAANMIGIM